MSKGPIVTVSLPIQVAMTSLLAAIDLMRSANPEVCQIRREFYTVRGCEQPRQQKSLLLHFHTPIHRQSND